MTTLHNLTAKEIHAIIHALRIADETGELREFIRTSELQVLRNKLQNVKD